MLSTTSIVSPTLSYNTNRAASSFHNSVERTLTQNPSLSHDIGIKNADQLTYSTRMKSEARQSMILGNNLQGVISHSQTQESFLKLAIRKYDRMSVLAAESQNTMLSNAERANLQTEFDQHRADIFQMRNGSFNGNNLFRGKLYEVIQFDDDNDGSPDPIDWERAYNDAKNRDAADPNNHHYMATITSYAEQIEIKGQIGKANTNAWLGGSDNNIDNGIDDGDSGFEGNWRWVTGPEKGQQFWQGSFGDPQPSNLQNAFNNWGLNEPNDSGGEDYLQISVASVPQGSWNDLPNTDSAHPSYQPMAYVLETDQGQQTSNLTVGSLSLENISLPTFVDSSVISIDSIGNAESASSDIQLTLNKLHSQMANVGSNLSQAEMSMDRMMQRVVTAESSFSRMSDNNIANDFSNIAKNSLRSESSSAILAQAKGITSKLTETLLQNFQ